MKQDVLDTHQKARQLNLDTGFCGTIAEVGFGPVVARWFFRIGGASGTIAKTMNAFDMTFGDAIYGPCEHHVSRERLETMLEHEYWHLLERLADKRGEKTAFFAFASTVAILDRAQSGEAHGWLGIRFQSRPAAEPSQIAVHVRLLDREQVREQDVLGVLGVNLVYGARCHHRDPDALLLSLLDNLLPGLVAVDVVEFSGPEFATMDDRLMSRKLAEAGLSAGSADISRALRASNATRENAAPNPAMDLLKRKPLPVCPDRPCVRRGIKPALGGLIDSVHLAGMPRAA